MEVVNSVLAAAQQAYATVVPHVDSAEKDILAWGNPAITIEAPTRAFPLAKLKDALAVLALYLVLVIPFYLFALVKKEKKEGDSDKDAQVSVWGKIKREPVMILMFLYNPAQVSAESFELRRVCGEKFGLECGVWG